jgi:small subunit ribosomal protein S17
METSTTKKTTTAAVKKAGERKRLTGVVVSTKMKDAALVLVERFVKNPKYKKYINLRKKYTVSDPGNTKKEGEKVTIESCRPLSRRISFRMMA